MIKGPHSARVLNLAHMVRFAPDLNLAHMVRFATDFNLAHMVRFAPDLNLAHTRLVESVSAQSHFQVSLSLC